MKLYRDYKAKQGVTRVDAKVTFKDMDPVEKSDSWIYMVSFTFTGIHPTRGPFRVTRSRVRVGKKFYWSIPARGTVSVCYREHAPGETCEFEAELDGEYKASTKKIDPVQICLCYGMPCLWFGSCISFPLVLMGQHLIDSDPMGAGLIGLAMLITVGITCVVLWGFGLAFDACCRCKRSDVEYKDRNENNGRNVEGPRSAVTVVVSGAQSSSSHDRELPIAAACVDDPELPIAAACVVPAEQLML